MKQASWRLGNFQWERQETEGAILNGSVIQKNALYNWTGHEGGSLLVRRTTKGWTKHSQKVFYIEVLDASTQGAAIQPEAPALTLRFHR